MLTFEKLVEDFRELGVREGDTLFIHSSYKSFGGVEGGPQTVIDALLDAIEPQGTLIMPTFNYDFLKGVSWDFRNTPSQMGVLTEQVRTDPRAKRMHHAIYSMSAIGQHADELAAHRSNDCFGETTIFRKFRDWDAKILILGLPYSKSITFLHHCEQAAGVEYRFLKEFKGAAIEVARRLAAKPLPLGSMSVRFWFGPETIGSIAYLAHHEDLIPHLRGGIFIEMTGNDNTIALQHTRQHEDTLDRVGQFVLRQRGAEFREGKIAEITANDERVLNGPGVNVPCLSISGFPYPEYHTTEDNLNIIQEEKLQEAADIIEEIMRVYASNYIPKRIFRGPVFLSGNGLWVDWRENWDLNRAIEKIMMRFEGRHTVFDIAEQVGLDGARVRREISRERICRDILHPFRSTSGVKSY